MHYVACLRAQCYIIQLFAQPLRAYQTIALMDDDFFDCAGWQAMLNREQVPVATACIGLLRRPEYVARAGTLLLWRSGKNGMEADLRSYQGTAGRDVAVLLVADSDAIEAMRTQGLAAIPAAVRAGRLHPYMLKTLDELESAGLADFVEDLGLTFPKH